MFNHLKEKAYICAKCSSDYIEEKFDKDTKEYYILCNCCGNESSRTLILEEAVELWNKENFDSEYETYLKSEIKFLERKISHVSDEISGLEDEINVFEEEIAVLEKELNNIKQNRYV